MMKKTLPLALLAASIVAIAACSGGGGGGGDDDDDDDDDAGTPGVGEVRLTIDAVPHPDQVALFRLKRQGGGGNAPPTVCSQTTLDGTGQGVLTSAGLIATEAYNRVELVLNLDGNALLNIGTDHIYNYATEITASAVSGTDIVFDHDDPAGTGWVVGAGGPTDPPGQFSWVDGAACPGE